MRFSYILLALLLSASTGASAEKLAYYSPSPRYELEIRTNELILRTAGSTRVLKRNECNNAFITKFIRDTRAAFEKNPSARGTPRQAFAEWDGKRRLIVETLRRSSLPLLPEHFMTLITRNRQQCR